METENNYLKQLQDWTKESSSPTRGTRHVEFLAAKDDIQNALHAGYPMKIIWRNMRERGRITSSYELFVSYIKKYKLKST